MSESVFIAAGDGRFVATDFARGPWDPGALHGGAPAALLIRAFERLDPVEGLRLARVTYEFVRPVPLGELQVEASVVRPGRRVRLLDGSIRDANGVEVVRARALEVRRAAVTAGNGVAPVPTPGPAQGRPNNFEAPYRPMFAPDSIEIRFAQGGFYGDGMATGWFRLRVPIVAGETPTALQALAAAGDFGNGISSPLPWREYVFINPDLTLYIERDPEGEWICLESQTRVVDGGLGISESVLYDQRGRIGRATQALFVAPR